jgi:exopolyphosphatase/guanosine-5'-triphosphate,3'-diphosphate pyrophosphatase
LDLGAYNQAVRKAVVDVGSNSLILTVFENGPDGWTSIFETTRVTGLGRDTKTTGKLSEDRVSASLSALAEFVALAVSHGASGWVAGGTMAVRIASNSEDFLRRAERLGTPVTVVSGDQEARLGFLSVVDDPGLKVGDRVAIVDPGGHSTEITVARREVDGWTTEFARSFPFGALGLRETLLTSAAPTPGERLAAMAFMDDAMVDVPAANGPVVVLGATGTNLVSIREGMTQWSPHLVHGAMLDYEEIGRAVEWLCGMDDSKRGEIVGLERGRETTIHGGTLILERCLYALKAESCLVSVHGWRHALANHPDLVPGLVVRSIG